MKKLKSFSHDKPFILVFKKILVALSLLLMFPFFSSNVFATGSDVNTSTISGKIIKVDGNNISVDTSNGTKQFNLNNDLKITKDSANVKTSDLKVNDEVKVKLADNEVLSVEASSDKSGLMWLIPIITISLAVVLLIAYLVGKGKRGQIKTSVENLQ